MSPQTSATVASILDGDEVYSANMTAVVHRHSQRKISDRMFGHYQDWLMRSALRRHGLSLHNDCLVRRAV